MFIYFFFFFLQFYVILFYFMELNEAEWADLYQTKHYCDDLYDRHSSCLYQDTDMFTIR